MPRKLSAKAKIKRGKKSPNKGNKLKKMKKVKKEELSRSMSMDDNISLTEDNIKRLNTLIPGTNESKAFSYPNSHISTDKISGISLSAKKNKGTDIIVGDSWEDINELLPNQKNDHKLSVLKRLNKDIQSRPTRALFYFRNHDKVDSYMKKLRVLAAKHSNAEICVSIIEMIGTLLLVSDIIPLQMVGEIITVAMKSYNVSIIKQIGWKVLSLAGYKSGEKGMIKIMNEISDEFIFEDKKTYKIHENSINGYIEPSQYEQKNSDINSIVTCIESYSFMLSELDITYKQSKDILKSLIKGIKNNKHYEPKLEIGSAILILLDKKILNDEDKEYIIKMFNNQIPNNSKQKHNKSKDGRRQWSELINTVQYNTVKQIESIKINKVKYYFDQQSHLTRYNFVKSIIKHGFQIHCMKNPLVQRILYIDEIQPKISNIDKDNDDDDDRDAPINYSKKAHSVLQRIHDKKHRQKSRDKDRKAKVKKLLFSND